MGPFSARRSSGVPMPLLSLSSCQERAGEQRAIEEVESWNAAVRRRFRIELMMQVSFPSSHD